MAPGQLAGPAVREPEQQNRRPEGVSNDYQLRSEGFQLPVQHFPPGRRRHVPVREARHLNVVQGGPQLSGQGLVIQPAPGTVDK